MSSVETIEIPDKNFFKIGEVASLLDLEPHVLRYWEGEFDVLDPDKTDSGQRVYQCDDIELIVRIRHLLYEEMFTIAGARRQLERARNGKRCYFNAEERARAEVSERLEELRQQNDELTEERDRLAEELEEERHTRQPELFEDKIAAQAERIEELEEELQVTHEELTETRRKLDEAASQTGLDTRLVERLRQEVRGLAHLAQEPV